MRRLNRALRYIVGSLLLGVLAGALNFIRHFEKHEAWRTVKRTIIAFSAFLGNDTFPNLYDALVYERKFKSEYLDKQTYERLLKSEPSIVKLIKNKSDLSKLMYIE